MIKNTPKVSIIMATFNRAHFIWETLDSILKQTFENWECLIIDDGSTDKTSEIIKLYLEKEPRLKYFSRSLNHKKGLSGCRNQGLELALGEYIIFFDDDDIVHPQNLVLCLKAFQEEKLDFCSYQKQPFFRDKSVINFEKQELNILKKIDKNDLEAILKNETPMASCTVMWKKACFKNEKFHEDLMYAEEWECYSRIVSNNKQGIVLKNVMYFNRKHPNSNTGEFYNNNPMRKASKIKAVRLVTDNLKQKKLLTPSLIKYLIRLAFSLESSSLLDHILKQSNSGNLKNLKYKLGYTFYPILKPLFKIKGKLTSS